MPEPIDQTTLDLIAAIKELKFATAEADRYVLGGGAEHQAAREREARAIERVRDRRLIEETRGGLSPES